MNVNASSPNGSSTWAKDIAAAPVPAERPARILVVDDVADNREILTRRLLRRGFEVSEASGGMEALRAIEEQDLDLVLLDIMMPDLVGTDVVRRVRETKSPSDLPIIMVSAMTQSEDVSQALELGANDYVTKPVDFTIALARIAAQLDRKRAADASGATLRQTSRQLEAETMTRKQSENQLRYLAYHDALTGILNRVAFRERLEEILANPGMVAKEPTLIFIDLDRFKAVNDVHGHQAGDKLLCEVGRRLTQVLEGGLAIARLGGDEFAALILEDGNPERGKLLADKVVATLQEPFLIDEQLFQIGASCGVARASLCEGRAELIMKASDLAMYRAKLGGRGRTVVYEPRLLEEQRERSTTEIELRRAVTSGMLQVFYQPLIKARTKQLTCFEALVRWEHPVRGFISPEVFIPIAEETGLIHELGAWVLQQACAEAATWPNGIRVAVNLSPVQFRHPDLLATIAGTLVATGLEPHRLELEITESGLLEAGDRNTHILSAIRDLGIRVSIDDFGTGYSTMSYLQNFVFDKLKIDRRFVQGLDTGPNSAAIINAITKLSAEIGIETTAEGIETEDQFSVVLNSGCSEVQGYLFSRPLKVEAAREFISEMCRPPAGE